MTQDHDIIAQETGNAKHHLQCSAGFVKMKNSVQDVLFDDTLILPWKIQVTHEMTK